MQEKHKGKKNTKSSTHFRNRTHDLLVFRLAGQNCKRCCAAATAPDITLFAERVYKAHMIIFSLLIMNPFLNLVGSISVTMNHKL